MQYFCFILYIIYKTRTIRSVYVAYNVKDTFHANEDKTPVAGLSRDIFGTISGRRRQGGFSGRIVGRRASNLKDSDLGKTVRNGVELLRISIVRVECKINIF